MLYIENCFIELFKLVDTIESEIPIEITVVKSSGATENDPIENCNDF